MPITADDVQGMVRHWLGCPPNGYLGSGYGSTLPDLLQTPLHSGEADAVLRKLRADIPVCAQLPGDVLSIYTSAEGADRMNVYVDVAGEAIPAAVARFSAEGGA